MARSQGLQRCRLRQSRPFSKVGAFHSQVDALIARNQETEEMNHAATMIQARVRGRRGRRAKFFVSGGRRSRGGSGRASPADGGGGGSSVDASPVGARPTAVADSVAFTPLPPPDNLQTDTMGRISRLCFGNFLDEVVGDFTSVAGTEAAAVRNNPAMLELAQQHHEARDEARDERGGQPIRPKSLKQPTLARR